MDSKIRTNNEQTNPGDWGVTFINPEEVIAHMELQPGSQVADFGCGTGYFVFPIAKKLKDGGAVYALDILKEKLETIEGQAKILGLSNIVTRRVNLEKMGGSKFEDESLDWVVIKDMLFQNKDKGAIVEEAKRVLKTGGKILIVEWNDQDFSVGPQREVRISQENMKNLVGEKQLTILKEFEAGNFHYGLILAK